ncbi:MAG: ketopantoate reductase family protein [Thermoplasmata archaeon]
MRVLVFGAGAIGSLFGARLSAAGHVVTLVGRPEHVRAIRASGLRIEGEGAGVFPLAADTTIPPGPPPEAILLAVKSFDLAEASGAIGRRFPGPIPLLLPQNGWGIEPTVRRALEVAGWPAEATVVLRFVHSIPATLIRPGAVRAAGHGTLLLPAPDGPSDGALGPLRALLESMGYPIEWRPDFDRAVWEKLLVNAAINPVTADHGLPNGRLNDDPLRGQALALLGEARRAAELSGIRIPAEEAERRLWAVVRSTASNRSSMLQDLERGRPTEIEAISGALVEIARSHGERLPHTERVLARIRSRTARRRGAPGSASDGPVERRPKAI